jgi:coenzyme F420-0:L-glutamate ligase/coenzyme F420-1:gamma-L-glutamate ligase
MHVMPIEGIGEIHPGDDLAGMIATHIDLVDGDVVVVTQKVVSKAENRLVFVDPEDPDGETRLVEGEASRVLRRRGDLIATETHHGFICTNAGVGTVNVPVGQAALLPIDPDRSARRIRDGLRARVGVEVGVVISDAFGRAWRRGETEVAIGCAGIAAIVSRSATGVCVVDEIAAAADLVMGKDRFVPAAVVRGIDPLWLRPSSVAEEVVRPSREDLFR